jgi:phosphatidylglycerophosphate synthase
MSVARWQWPDAPLRTSALGTGAVVLVGLVVFSAAAQSVLEPGAHVPFAAGAFFAVLMLIAIGFLSGHHPFASFGPANQVSTTRAALATLVCALAFEPPAPRVAGLAAAVAVAATLLDGLDGRLARQSGMSSAFGARFDLEIDALLIMALAVVAWRHDKAGAWVLLSGLMRYAFVAASWVWPWLDRPLRPSFRRQAVCVVQVGGLIVTVLPSVVRPASAIIAAGALIVLSYSFLVDVTWLARNRGDGSHA